ncbi:MAG: ferrochelatase [candidate division NC10 bacterium]|nr:ferrochelatase [candidate division NC10 bacterium]
MIGVLLMAYGTPRSRDEVAAYFTHIRRGRKPTPEDVEELTERYQAIGGASPLYAITEAQAKELQSVLDRKAPARFTVYLAMKHAPPFITEVVQRMIRDGVPEMVALVLAPHESVMIIDDYMRYARDVLDERPDVKVHVVRSWHLNPKYLSALAKRIQRELAAFVRPEAHGTMVLFTAHSLPEKILARQDPYPTQLEETARALAKRLALPHWRRAYQSAGKTAFPWLGPDLVEVLEEVKGEGYSQVLVVPIGFVADHLEILYDIDLEAQEKARELGLTLRRTESLNTDPELVEGLAEEVLQATASLPR